MLIHSSQMLESLKPIVEAYAQTLKEQLQHKKPYFIGVVGPMAIGKSTFCQVLKTILEQTYHHKVCIINTDGFLYSNAILESRGIMSQKGFPISFHQESFYAFLDNLKSQKKGSYSVPFYNHAIKDVDPQEMQTITTSDIYIIEGINLLFGTTTKSDWQKFYDDLILLKMPLEDIQSQSWDRFLRAWEYGKKNQSPYFKEMMDYSEQQIKDYFNILWENINAPFKKEYIDPFESLVSHCISVPHIQG